MKILKSTFYALALATMACLFIPGSSMAQDDGPDDPCLYVTSSRTGPGQPCFNYQLTRPASFLSMAIQSEPQLIGNQRDSEKKAELPEHRNTLDKMPAVSPVIPYKKEMTAVIEESWKSGHKFPF